jgi:hypothetical protein
MSSAIAVSRLLKDSELTPVLGSAPRSEDTGGVLGMAESSWSLSGFECDSLCRRNRGCHDIVVFEFKLSHGFEIHGEDRPMLPNDMWTLSALSCLVWSIFEGEEDNDTEKIWYHLCSYIDMVGLIITKHSFLR